MTFGSPPTRAAVYADSGETATHPHGSVVEQVHRILTTKAYRDECDPWMLAEELVKFVQGRMAAEINTPEPRNPWRAPVMVSGVKRRALAALRAGETAAAVAERFGYPLPTVERWAAGTEPATPPAAPSAPRRAET